MTEGIPVVYYGTEQGFTGQADPVSIQPIPLHNLCPPQATHDSVQDNREPLWPSGYKDTTTHGLIASLNQFRNFLVSNTTVNSQHPWLYQNSTFLQNSDVEIVVSKGGVISIVNVLGSPVSTCPTHCLPRRGIGSLKTWLMTNHMTI